MCLALATAAIRGPEWLTGTGLLLHAVWDWMHHVIKKKIPWAGGGHPSVPSTTSLSADTYSPHTSCPRHTNAICHVYTSINSLIVDRHTRKIVRAERS